MCRISLLCSNERMDDVEPDHPRRTGSEGAAEAQRERTISCGARDCVAAVVERWSGYLLVQCPRQPCTEAPRPRQPAAGTRAASVGQVSDAHNDEDRSRVVAALDSVWTLLRQAPEYQMTLLESSHPDPTRLARLGSWIQGCAAAVRNAQSLEALMARSDEVAHIEEIAAGIDGLVDAFHIYVSLLERFRRADKLTPVLPPRSHPLAAVADDERTLLGCRVALRSSIKQLTTAL